MLFQLILNIFKNIKLLHLHSLYKMFWEKICINFQLALFCETWSLIIIKQKVCGFVSLCSNSPEWEILPNLVWRYLRYGVRTIRRNFFWKSIWILKIQMLSDFFFWIFFFIIVCLMGRFMGSFLLNIAHFRFWLHITAWEILFWKQFFA